jgi:hypothetical protein
MTFAVTDFFRARPWRYGCAAGQRGRGLGGCAASAYEYAYVDDTSIDVDEHAERIYELLRAYGYARENLNYLRDASEIYTR